MPELPEVETTRRGIASHIEGAEIKSVIIRQPRLRWPIPADLAQTLEGRKILSLSRRAKYLLFSFEHGTLIIHLGMSGNLRVLTEAFPAEKHDHFDLVLSNGKRLRYRDPRRFGACLWQATENGPHPLLQKLGPEPLSEQFNTDHLLSANSNRKIAIKLAIMDNHTVVGVGNIYASESLFRAKINPNRAANSLNPQESAQLVAAIKATLGDAIIAGGSTLRDYVDSDGKAGYFQLSAFVYGRAGMPCRICNSEIKQIRQGQRSTFYCPHCQH
ncbi:bifunctional DNA-formamidopyrimidine glycosylase/DNA-(apurinic or apyrimidinic site) lyase [Iodobacter sp. LRB]|uniref:bifunctional DNA-formamidopyrimidine glycosylase/DNA-(apurinic or apyrimidinic site) lyase n=1 Tax=unclassified Iodobacter TaxID=235634 RepID=UPI000C0CAF6D|nr:bifunctional DNA-formamidopyrimidine glycosylase/DNA-(apurinic or apyrimidinic site) lyase [Iodobacter sp. BJB302]PHV03084.1 DNA-formamidopyrimidine glycosylase [Iodobacter sp. BJB302]